MAAYSVAMMEASLMSSDQMRAVESPTVRKFLGKKGFLCREIGRASCRERVWDRV